jgi:hypothetical protein
MHFGDTDPKGWLNKVHAKVFFSTGSPTTWIIAIEAREGHLRELASGVIQPIGIWKRWTRRWVWLNPEESLWVRRV